MDPTKPKRSHTRIDRILGHFRPLHQYGFHGHPTSSASQYKYTVSGGNGLLSELDRQFYERNGYLVVRNLIPKEELLIYKQRFLDLIDGKVSASAFIAFMKDVTQKNLKVSNEHTVTKITGFHQDEVLWNYCQHPDIVKYVECFTGPDIKSVHTMVIHKPPDVGPSGRHPFHQDLHYFPFRPADRIVGVWTAMEDVDRNNGCLSVIPGSHTRPLQPHIYPEFLVNVSYHAIQGISDEEMAQRVHLPMKAGDTVFFHPLLYHASGWNKTKGFRKAISCHYASSHCDYIQVKGTTQEHIEAEIEQVVEKFLKKRGIAVQVSFHDLWKSKSRLVQGKEGTL